MEQPDGICFRPVVFIIFFLMVHGIPVLKSESMSAKIVFLETDARTRCMIMRKRNLRRLASGI